MRNKTQTQDDSRCERCGYFESLVYTDLLSEGGMVCVNCKEELIRREHERYNNDDTDEEC